MFITNFDVRYTSYYLLIVSEYNKETGSINLWIVDVDDDTKSLYGNIDYKTYRKYSAKNASRIKEMLGLKIRTRWDSHKWK